MKKALILTLLLLLLPLAGCEKGQKDPWVAALPWEAEWTCLLLWGWEPGWELEPEAGKEALRTLLTARRWAPAEAEPGEEEERPFREIRIWCGEDSPLTLTLNERGDACWNGSWHRPQGEGAGEKLLADFLALAETGVNMGSPPSLTLLWGTAEAEAFRDGTYSWMYVTRAGQGFGCESDSFLDLSSVDWLDPPYSFGPELLRAEGEVTLSFSDFRMPERMSLYAVSPYGSLPVELREGRFTPYAGINAYILGASWDTPKDRSEQGGGGSASYVLLVEGACPCSLPPTEASPALTLLSADAWGCSLTLTAGDRSFVIGSDKQAAITHLLLRRTDFGGWEWLKPLAAEEAPRLTFDSGRAADFRLDWSRTLGPLEPGEYCLLLRGYYGGSYAGDLKYLSLPFTLEDAALPEPPGPLTVQETPEGIGSELSRRGFHRWTQTLALSEGGKYGVDRDYSLFRLEKDGSLAYIPPECALPAALNTGAVLNPQAAELTLDVELARFGELEAGDYVLRRRLLRLEKGEKTADWRLIHDPDRVLYVDTVFSTGDLKAVAGRVEPILPSPAYYGPSSVFRSQYPAPLHIQAEAFGSAGCLFTAKNLGDRMYTYYPEEYTLFFLEQGEWFPLERERHYDRSRTTQALAPGESGELALQFDGYPDLAPGEYRVVLPLYPKGEGDAEWLTAKFTVYSDYAGAFTGEMETLEAVILDYKNALTEAYVWPEAQEVYPRLFLLSDPYVTGWRVRQERGGFVVTVRRDRDLERAEALLADFAHVRAERGEDPATGSSPVTGDNLGSRGELRAEPVEQTDPRLFRESLWILTFRWEGEEAYRRSAWVLYVERKAGDSWQVLPEGSRAFDGYIEEYDGWPLVLEPGENTLVFNLGYCRTEFDPEAEYRFVLGILSPEGKPEYYPCPFSVSEAGEA